MCIGDDPAKVEKIISKELKSVKYKAFGKVTVNKRVISSNIVTEPIDDQMNVAVPPSNSSLLAKQSDLFMEKISRLKETKSAKGKSAAVFQLRDDVMGGKKAPIEPSVITDPCSKAKVYAPEEIKKVSLSYCKNLLTNRQAKEPFVEDLEIKDLFHFQHYREFVEDDHNELTVEQFERTMSTLLKKKPTKYEFLLKGGYALKKALFHLCRVTWRTEEIPPTWHKSTLVQLYKGKGDRTELENYRHIHLKDDIPKVFGHLVMSAARDKLFSSTSKF